MAIGRPFFMRSLYYTDTLSPLAVVASSPKRHLWWMKRGEDGAVVKIHRRSKP